VKILVADRIAPAGVEFLKSQSGYHVLEAYDASSEELNELIADAVALIVRSETQVTEALIRSAKQLKVIGRAGVGIDNIEVPAATRSGVVVLNAPSGNTVAAAELTMAHLLCAARPVAQACASVKSGKWDRKDFSGWELSGKTLGVVGLGRIGYEVTRRARAFGMRIIAFDPNLVPERAKQLGIPLVALDALLSQADCITLHLPLLDSTHHLIDAAAIGKMRDGVVLVNCARGGIIDETALAEAVKSGKVAAAGLDVFEKEPLAEKNDLRGLGSVILTPHLGASTKEAQEGVGLEVAEAVLNVIEGRPASNCVNMPSVDADTLFKLKPYLTLATRLGTLVQQLATSTPSALKITYYGGLADMDTQAIDRAIQQGFLRNISGESVNAVNAPLKMKELGVDLAIGTSSAECEYKDLIEIEALSQEDTSIRVGGSIFGKGHTPRLVFLGEHAMEVVLDGILLILENKDIPGIVGMLGDALARDGINIANLSLSRTEPGARALSVFSLDEPPASASLGEIALHEAISRVHLVHCD